MVVALADLERLVLGQKIPGGEDIKPIFQIVVDNDLPINFGTRIKGALVPAASEILVNNVVTGIITQVHPDVLVRWSVTSRYGKVNLTEYVSGSTTGYYYHSNNGLFGPLLDVALAPTQAILQELTENNMSYQPIIVEIHAQIKLKAMGVETDWLELPVALEIPIRPILIPTIAAFFKGENFQGPCLMMVPTNSSMFIVEDVLEALQLVISAFNAIQSVPYFADNLKYALPIAWLSRILNLIKSRQVTINLRCTDKEPNLNDRDLQKGFWNDIEAEDTLNSLIFISVGKLIVGTTGVGAGSGPRLPAALSHGELAGGTYYDTLQCYYDRDYEGYYFEISPKNAICAALRDFRKPLHSMVRGSEVRVKKEPPAKRYDVQTRKFVPNVKYFGSELSSVRMSLGLFGSERKEIAEGDVS